MKKREKTKKIVVGNIQIGNQDKIIIQSMTNTRTNDIEKTIKQINLLKKHGAELVRLAILNLDDANAIKEIVNKVDVPLVADIHFESELALKAIENGIHKIRINPGNIDNLEVVIEKAKQYKIPIRVGVNSGSLSEAIELKYGNNARGIFELVKEAVTKVEQLNFFDIVISAKSTNVLEMIEAYQLIADYYDYPLHLGLTEAGSNEDGIIKSSLALSPLIINGIGDTIRISITEQINREHEVIVAKKILNNLGYKQGIINIFSCPTCGRLEVDLYQIEREIKEHIKKYQFTNVDLDIAILGCVVNGIGEGKQADVGLAGGRSRAILFKRGKIYKNIKGEENIITEFKQLIDEVIEEKLKQQV